MQSEQQQRIMEYFIEEAKDHLNTIEQGLLSLQSTIDDREMINEVFRAAHSVKGGAAMLGLSSIQQTSHRLEDCFKVLQESPIKADYPLESLFLQVFDTLQALLEQLQAPLGLTDEAANDIMSEAEPVFQELNAHLETLVQQAERSSVATVEASQVALAYTQMNTGNSKTLPATFKRDVLVELREMLQLFKQQDLPEHREALQHHCRRLARLGESLSLPSWGELLETARAAIAVESNSYRLLANLVIKEIKQAQELAIAGRLSEIQSSEQLKALVPESALIEPITDFEALNPEAHHLVDEHISFDSEESDTATELSDIDSDDLATPLEDFSEEDDFPLETLADFSQIQPPAPTEPEKTRRPFRFADPSEPEVGMAELNTLADIFEGQTPDLDETWQEEEIISLNDTASPSDSGNLLGEDESGDFSDFMSGTEDSAYDLSDSVPDEWTDLLADDSTAAEGVAYPNDLEADFSAQDLTDINTDDLNLEFSPLTTELDTDDEFADLLFDTDSESPQTSSGSSEDLSNLFGDSFFEDEDDQNLNDFGFDPNAASQLQQQDDHLFAMPADEVAEVFNETSSEFLTPPTDTSVADENIFSENFTAQTDELLDFEDSSVDLESLDRDEEWIDVSPEIPQEQAALDNLDMDLGDLLDLSEPSSPESSEESILENEATDLGLDELSFDESAVDFDVEGQGDLTQEEGQQEQDIYATTASDEPTDEATFDNFIDFSTPELEDAENSTSLKLEDFTPTNEPSSFEDWNWDEGSEITLDDTGDLDLGDDFTDTAESAFSFPDIPAEPMSTAPDLVEPNLTEDWLAWEETPVTQSTGDEPDLALDDFGLEQIEAVDEASALDFDFQETSPDLFDLDQGHSENEDIEDLLAQPEHHNVSADSVDIFDDLDTSGVDTTELGQEELELLGLEESDTSSDANEWDDTFDTDAEHHNVSADSVDIFEDLDTSGVDTTELDQEELELLGLEESDTSSDADEWGDTFDTEETIEPDIPSLEAADSTLDFEDFSLFETPAEADSTGFSPAFAPEDDALAALEFEPNATESESLADFSGLETDESGLFDLKLEDTDPTSTGLESIALESSPESSLDDLFGEEISSPISPESSLDDLFDEEISSPISPESSLDDLFGEEISSPTSPESGLDDLFGEEISSPTSPESGLDDLFDEEISSPTSSESGLDDLFGEEISLDTETGVSASHDLDLDAEGLTDDTSSPQLELEADAQTSQETESLMFDWDESPQIEDEGVLLESTSSSDFDLEGFFDETDTWESSQDNEFETDEVAASLAGLATEATDTDLLNFEGLEDENPVEAENLDELLDADAVPDARDWDELLDVAQSSEGLDFDEDESSQTLEFDVEAGEAAPMLDFDWDTDPSEHSVNLEEFAIASDTAQKAIADTALTEPELAQPQHSSFDDLEALLNSNPSAESTLDSDTDAFADLDAMLADSMTPEDNSALGALDITASAALDAQVDVFGDLDALLTDQSLDTTTPITSLSISDKTDALDLDAEFGDLESLLKDAETKMGGPPSVPETGRTRSSLMRARPISRPTRADWQQTMRVPVKHLDSLSNLVGELVVNRNTLEQDQERLRQFLDNLSHQVLALSDVGARMQDLYERSLLESSLLASRHNYRPSSHADRLVEPKHASGVEYDPLEMDRFTGFHLLSQEMIELIVRVRESASDIEFLVDETDQVARMLRQVTTQLQEGLTRARMVPFAQNADRLLRAVHEISRKLGKEAQLVVEGRETLIDKMILEHLYDPMTHLVNNALTHGIERPEVRKAANKPTVGKVTLRAFHQGNQTVIAIADDGAGIDPERVRAKAIQQKLISANEAKALTNIELYDFLFHPGFSTKDKADDFAGRGVGMDVVRTSLSECRGTIHIDSAPAKGTTFTIRLPLTLSICKALCCLSDRARIAFPMDGVEDMMDVSSDRIQIQDDGQHCIQWRDTLLTIHPLAELLTYKRQLSRNTVYGGKREDNMVSIVVLRSTGNYIAIHVDQVLGEQEIVIKQLEGPPPKPVGIAGATVLGDGRIMAIADVLELIDLAMGRIRKDGGVAIWQKEEPAPEIPVDVPDTKTEPMVLIVDDSITVRELLSMTFNKAGYRVEQARDGQEAWEKLRSGLPCDIVFCDIEMPRMDGLELLSRLQKDENLSHLPIAMLTSRGADRHRQMAAQLGASGYFTKPYLEEVLLDAAQRMIKGEVLFSSSNA
jgi:chemosensory pili system protein ChpA (sensor histidine kinase/response regulator)